MAERTFTLVTLDGAALPELVPANAVDWWENRLLAVCLVSNDNASPLTIYFSTAWSHWWNLDPTTFERIETWETAEHSVEIPAGAQYWVVTPRSGRNPGEVVRARFSHTQGVSYALLAPETVP